MFCGSVVADFANCFVSVCNRSKKVFRDCLDKNNNNLVCLAGFATSLRADLGLLVWVFCFFFVFEGIIYVTIDIEMNGCFENYMDVI